MIIPRALSSLTAVSLIAALVAPAAADSRTIQVLKTQGKIDAAMRTKIDAAILEHAKADATATAGDITFSEAAAAVGCKPETAACKDEVREMLAVDEVVYANAARKPGTIELTVYRVAKGGIARELKTSIPSDKPVDKLAGVAPLFINARPVTPAEPTPTPTPTTPTPTPPPATPTPTPAPTGEATLMHSEIRDGETASSTLPSTTPGQPHIVDAPTHPNRRLQMIGMIGGGAMVFVGLMCWGAAADLQDQVDIAPTATRAQIDALRDLEKRGDGYAGLGNLLFLGGAVLGGLSTYYFVKGRQRTRAAVTATRITPTVFDGGAGVIIGGSL
ncbi:MAG: hypothetical protein SFX73_25545 [Kofleriaceae bacterium]|nr:hypothetical protein [Kofleriaceae bacterium]